MTPLTQLFRREPIHALSAVGKGSAKVTSGVALCRGARAHDDESTTSTDHRTSANDSDELASAIDHQ
eukprot:CAMPEP_0174853646 /NCGR_PEP_ID=MMETSP1114-20130205/29314_1 /TAXON_ID=312471 /ORGANISM="Neobodo designis, Strain CCAP 1951/1" /LENGTH=66 /DNA_ID=CAMNT_0016088305 /DNA_START=84 /DNA_END=285 /DNA_ORIENTATION=-